MHASKFRSLLAITEHRATLATGTSANGFPRRIELVDNTIVHIITMDGLQIAHPCHEFTGALFHEALGHWNEKDMHPGLLELITAFSNGIKLDTNKDEWE